jgi:hypothetical protein
VAKRVNKGIIPQGLMFLPDGKALIMDTDLYQEIIEKSIVVDLIGNSIPNDLVNPTQQNNNSQLQIEDHKQNGSRNN